MKNMSCDQDREIKANTARRKQHENGKKKLGQREKMKNQALKTSKSKREVMRAETKKAFHCSRKDKDWNGKQSKHTKSKWFIKFSRSECESCCSVSPSFGASFFFGGGGGVGGGGGGGPSSSSRFCLLLSFLFAAHHRDHSISRFSSLNYQAMNKKRKRKAQLRFERKRAEKWKAMRENEQDWRCDLLEVEETQQTNQETGYTAQPGEKRR